MSTTVGFNGKLCSIQDSQVEEYCVVYGKINLILNDLCENVLNYEFNPLSECHTEYKSIPN